MKTDVAVTLTTAEVARVSKFANDLCDYKRSIGVKSKNFDKGRISDYSLTVFGVLGEVAVAKYLGVPVDYDFYPGTDGGKDLEYAGRIIQIKTATKRTDLIFDDLNDFQADIAILVKHLGGNRDTVETDPRFGIVGWIERDDFMKSYQVKNYGFGDRAMVTERFLSPISAFCQKYEERWW